ncbi:MAG TPA: isochorismatase family protein [Devosiaceae bacterium]
MSESATALLVIDAQESFRHRPYWSERDLAAYLDRQQALIDGIAALGLPVVQILHSETEGVFSPASGYLRALEPLRIAPAVTFTKTRHSAFIGTGLDIWLRQHRIANLIVSGIRTEQCCETTTRNASDLGFSVDFVTEATLTFDMRADNGFSLDAAGIKARTELVLAHRFARISTVDEALARLSPARAA